MLYLANTDAPEFLRSTLHWPTLVAMFALAISCGVLSLVVFWRRWAFLGEGIAHAGFGGAGTAWLIASISPAADHPLVVSLCVAVFCLATAGGIGVVARGQRIHADTAIGAFLVGALAWGFVGQQVYLSVYGRPPAGFQALLFGHTELLTPVHAQLSLALLMLTLVSLAMFRRQVLLYCLDPQLAQTSGIRTDRVHYLLIVLIALAIMIGVRLVGSVLITAMLILPGATAVLTARRLGTTVIAATGVVLLATAAGILLNRRWEMLPQGPSIVLSLFALFIVVWRLKR